MPVEIVFPDFPREETFNSARCRQQKSPGTAKKLVGNARFFDDQAEHGSAVNRQVGLSSGSTLSVDASSVSAIDLAEMKASK
jgi:hypothetical protein